MVVSLCYVLQTRALDSWLKGHHYKSFLELKKGNHTVSNQFINQMQRINPEINVCLVKTWFWMKRAEKRSDPKIILRSRQWQDKKALFTCWVVDKARLKIQVVGLAKRENILKLYFAGVLCETLSYRHRKRNIVVQRAHVKIPPLLTTRYYLLQ